MVATRSPKIRRSREPKQQKLIDRLLDHYARNPDEALRVCFEHFGREKFENALRIYLHQHVAKVAMELAIKR